MTKRDYEDTYEVHGEDKAVAAPKETRPRAPRKTPLEQLEAKRDEFFNKAVKAGERANTLHSQYEAAKTEHEALDGAYKALDAAVRAQTGPQEVAAPMELGKTRGEVRS